MLKEQILELCRLYQAERNRLNLTGELRNMQPLRSV